MARGVRRRAPKRGAVAAPHADECPICDRPLGTVELLKRPGGWVHKSCWMEAHQ